jgi:predicted naringenin-chalcone synthase
MSLAILGIGTAVPPTTITQPQAQEFARSLCVRSPEHENWLPHLYSQTGIDKRHLCMDQDLIRDLLEGTRDSQSVFLPRDTEDDPGPTTGERMAVYRSEAPELAIGASRLALANARTAAKSITHVVTVSCTGFHAPGVDVRLIEELGLPATTQRTHVGYMGCHGALNGLRVARAYARSEPDARILLCAVELCSLHYHYGWDPQRIVANALFADGAAALVAAPAESAPTAWKVAACGSCLIPDSQDAMVWTVEDHGFVMTLSKQVPVLINAHLRPWLTKWLSANGVALSEVKSWAVHPGGPRILNAAAEALALNADALHDSLQIFAAHGNMSSPTVLFILDHLRHRNAPRPCVALGFGPGLAVEATLFV